MICFDEEIENEEFVEGILNNKNKRI